MSCTSPAFVPGGPDAGFSADAASDADGALDGGVTAAPLDAFYGDIDHFTVNVTPGVMVMFPAGDVVCGSTSGSTKVSPNGTTTAYPAYFNVPTVYRRPSDGAVWMHVATGNGMAALDESGADRWRWAELGCCNYSNWPIFALDWDSGTGLYGSGLFNIETGAGMPQRPGATLGNFLARTSSFLYLGNPTSDRRIELMRVDTWASLHVVELVAGTEPATLMPVAVTSDGSLVGSFVGESGIAMLDFDGSIRWTVPHVVATPPVITGDGLVVYGVVPSGADAATITARHPEDGSEAWTVEVAGTASQVLVADNGLVYAALGAAARIVGLDARTGATIQTIRATPVVQQMMLHDGRIVLATSTGTIGSFPVDAQHYDPRSSWPVRFHDNQLTANTANPTRY